MTRFILSNLGALSLLCLGSLTGAAMVVAGFDTETRSRQAVQREIDGARVDTLQGKQLTLATEAKAIQRYQGTCFVIAEGLTLVDQETPTYRFPQLAEGSYICDRIGNAGVIQSDGSIADIVRTDDKSVITRRLTNL